MAYCPQCSTEYTEGITQCDECHVQLLAGAPPAAATEVSKPGIEPGDELAAIRTFSGPTGSMDAELAQNILQTQGIPCALPGEGHAEVLPGIDVIHLLVRKQDAARAEEILKSYLDNPEAFSDEEVAKEEEEDEADEKETDSGDAKIKPGN